MYSGRVQIIITASGTAVPNFPIRPQMKFKTMFLQDGPKNPPAFLGMIGFPQLTVHVHHPPIVSSKF